MRGNPRCTVLVKDLYGHVIERYPDMTRRTASDWIKRLCLNPGQRAEMIEEV